MAIAAKRVTGYHVPTIMWVCVCVCVCVCVSGGYKNCYRSSLEGSDLKLNWPGNRCRAEPAVREEAHPAGTQQQGTGEGLGLDSG